MHAQTYADAAEWSGRERVDLPDNTNSSAFGIDDFGQPDGFSDSLPFVLSFPFTPPNGAEANLSSSAACLVAGYTVPPFSSTIPCRRQDTVAVTPLSGAAIKPLFSAAWVISCGKSPLPSKTTGCGTSVSSKDLRATDSRSRDEPLHTSWDEKSVTSHVVA